MLLSPSEAFSQVLFSYDWIKSRKDLAPDDRRMLDHNANKTFSWPSGIAIIVCHTTSYRINKGCDSLRNQFRSSLCGDGQGYAAEVPTQVTMAG
jgi:hypothetical protein